MKPWEADDCAQLRSHYTRYPIALAAILWCGVPVEDAEAELKNASAHPNIRGVWLHPFIPCLEPRCRVLHEAIDAGALPCSRENGRTVDAGDHVAPERRHVSRDDLKDWISRNLPAQKPAFLFDEIERSAHVAINADSFRVLQADRDALKIRVDKAVEAYKALKQERDDIEAQRAKLAAIVDGQAVPGSRAETTYLCIIGALMELVRSPRSGRETDAAVIRELIDNYSDKPGISKATLEAKFADARRRLGQP